MKSVEIIDPFATSQWDNHVASFSTAAFYHSSAWLKVLCETYKYRPACFVVRESAHISCMLPCLEIDTWLTGRRGVALPFTDECELLHAEGTGIQDLESHLLRHGFDRKWRSLALHGTARVFNEERPSLSFYRHYLALSPGPDKLFCALKGTTRNQVRQAQEQGVSVQIGSSPQLLDGYYKLHCRTRRKHGLPPQPVAFFRNIQRHCLKSGKGILTLAYHDGSPIAGALFLHFQKRAHYKYSASVEAKLQLRRNNLVM